MVASVKALNSGEVHCGKCGPCFMRKTAYNINGLADPLPYAE